MRKVVVTGATSFIGLPLVSKLLDNGDFVYAICRENSKNNYKVQKISSDSLKIIECNMDKYDRLSQLIDDDCEVFFHISWNGTRFPERDDVELQKSNYDNSMKAFISAKELGCKRFISVGSQAECGKCDGLITEEYICQPTTPYGKEKHNFLNSLLEETKNTDMTIGWLRLFSAYGPNDFGNSMISYTTKQLLENKPVELTTCKQSWNYIYVKDVVNLLYILSIKNYTSGVFNACSDENFVLKDYVLKMKQITNSKSELLFGAKDYNKEGFVSFTPSCEKIKNILEYKNFVSFNVGYKEYVAEQRQIVKGE